MFKKREIKKKTLDLDAINDQDKKQSNYEISIDKKIKFNSQYSTNLQTKEYQQTTDSLLDDFTYKASENLINENQHKALALAHPVATSILDLQLLEQEQERQKKTEEDKKERQQSKLQYKLKTHTNTAEPQSKPVYKNNSSIRVGENIDYNPSLCKDYHDTGYCAFGDSCIYIHDRGDYKSGWELEKEWQEEQQANAKGKYEQSEEDDQESIHEFCPCGQNTEVQTSCGCFMCEGCGLDSFRERVCRGCGGKSDGRLNNVEKVIQKLKEERDQKLQKEQAEKEEEDEFLKVVQKAQKRIEGQKMSGRFDQHSYYA